MTSKSKVWKNRFWQDENWQSGTHRIVFVICAACLSFYFSYLFFLARSPIFLSAWKTAASLLGFAAFSVLLFIGLCFGCYYWSQLLKKKPVIITWQKGSLGFFAVSMAVSLFLLGISFAAAYPGAVSYDHYNQWMQMQSGQLNSWHPVFHTLLLWLGAQMSGSYPGVVALQLVCFSVALAYLMETLRRLKISKVFLLVLQGLIVTTPLVEGVMVGVGKDNATTIGITLLCAQAIHIYFSKGEWLLKKRNVIVFGGTLAFTTLVRHNAFFLTGPLFLCALLSGKAQRGRILWAGGVWAMCMWLVTGPLYGALDIVKPNNLFGESIGIPMTILCDTRMEAPEKLDEETRAFLETLLPEEVFQEKYDLHRYNSIKFEWPMEFITYESPQKLFQMTLRTIRNNPRGAFETYNAVTDLAWGIDGQNEGFDAGKNSGDLDEYTYTNTRLNQLGKSVKNWTSMPHTLSGMKWVFQNIGVQMAFLLLCGLGALYRNGTRALMLCLPVLIYNLGTMLLLCGNDARFFQFVMVVAIPLMLALWRTPGDTQAE